MPANITSVTCVFGNGQKREEYGPVKKAEVSLTASVADDEDGAVVLAFISHVAMARVAEMLSAPRPEVSRGFGPGVTDQPQTAAGPQTMQADEAPPKRRGRPPKSEQLKEQLEESVKQEEPAAAEPAAEAATDDWEVGPAEHEITDQEILSATSKRAQELGAREPIVKLIATFATRTEGAPFKVQEIPQNQRKDYLEKLAALTA